MRTVNGTSNQSAGRRLITSLKPHAYLAPACLLFVACTDTQTAVADTESAIADTGHPQDVRIVAGTGIETRINVLTPTAGEKEEVIALLQRGMDEEMGRQPGFISSSIHSSRDSEHIVVYAQWIDAKARAAAGSLREQGSAPAMTEVFAIANPASHPYDVVSVHLPQGD